MKQHDAPVPTSGRQMSLVFEPRKVDAMKEVEQAEATRALAHLLMQAAGLIVEELGDERN
ncbi:hypothetical protein OF122_02055 [Pelagibacterium flavum]|uniref:Uncharacterized protein n=1 Tax=Pelagibacterium flavum TaxID=2984530 RepID=A0ABY6IL83_9HYPH|nr:hypothetical protein [Pelagibacterium sp. YIM 151497]UYQ71147.1 hypothetical protein OF122_13960 [Pelagibacterium sp. YIM 151497]UYQ71359.1 hypothetical protein OF122_15075 [Pelagibacterium sp. YIM 151497]UYQ72593.1 hypothetical protein OF122_02055 [Pelagibacterium sp. YIM 151497]